MTAQINSTTNIEIVPLTLGAATAALASVVQPHERMLYVRSVTPADTALLADQSEQHIVEERLRELGYI